MNTTLTERKNQAINYLKQLKVYKPYIKGFEEENLTCFFENYGGFWTYQDEELSQKIKEIETKYNSPFTPLHTNTPISASFTIYL